MLKLNVLKLLEERDKTKYWLFVQLGMTYTNYNNLIMNRTKSIKYETLDKLCEILECEPNDLFLNEKDEETKKSSSKSNKTSKSKTKAKAKSKQAHTSNKKESK